jgi:exodeoxyribonuclease V alpha subunit
MTVHKAQGSEFERVLLLLPEAGSPVLGRELLYTGLTRARSAVELWGSAAAISSAIATPLERASGLGDRLRNL